MKQLLKDMEKQGKSEMMKTNEKEKEKEKKVEELKKKGVLMRKEKELGNQVFQRRSGKRVFGKESSTLFALV